MMYKVVLSASMAAALVMTPAAMARDVETGTEDMVLADDAVAGRDLLASKSASKVKKETGSKWKRHARGRKESYGTVPTPNYGDQGYDGDEGDQGTPVV
jgi:hypothetical protein